LKIRSFDRLAAGAACSAMALAASVAAPAWAQSTTTAPSASTSSPNAGIADIVVTATRQSESLQKVPIAVTALSANALTQSNVTNLQNVAALSPGIQILPQFKPGDAIFQIRGQVQSDAAPTIDPSVGVYYDDVYIARSAGSLLDLLDVARVEVLKGPQGTLFGKNTTGGAIRIISNQPTHKFEGFIDGSYESFDHYRLQGVVNIPAGDTLAFRFAGEFNNKTGSYATNTFDNSDYDKNKTYAGRLSALWEPTDRLKILLEGDYSKIDAGGTPAFLRYYSLTNGPATALEAAVESGLGFNAVAGNALLQSVASAHGTRNVGSDLRDATAQSYTFDPATGQFTYVGGDPDPKSGVKTWGALANISYDMDFATLKSITAYRHVDARYAYDVDGSVYHILDSLQTVRSKQFSEELLLNGKALDDKLDWTVGGLYFNETPAESDQVVPLAGLSALAGSAGTVTIAHAKNKSYGVFGQGTYKFTDKLSVTGGVRYSIDKRGFDATAYNRATTGALSCLYTPANGLSLISAFQDPCDILQSKTFREVSYTGSLNYQIDPSKLIYFRTSRSYRAGGFNPRINAPEVVGSFKPEIVTDYEVGLKADWINHTLRTDIAVFHSDGSDVQETVNGISPTNGAAITTTENIGKSRVTGAEFSVTARPSSFLSFDAGLSYLHARSKNPNTPDVTFLQQVAPWTWNIGMNLDTPFSDDLKGHLRVDLSFRDKMHDGAPLRDPATNAIILEGFYRDVTLLGARYTIHEGHSGIELSVYGKNLTNQLYEGRAFNVGGLGIGIGNLAEPRVIGVELKVPFGAMSR
jgi:iron complex outermembrane receptor protein